MFALACVALLAQAGDVDRDSVLLKTGIRGGQTVHDLQESMARFCAEAVFEASRQNDGALTTAGTLTQEEEGFSYSAEPADRLKVVLSEDTFDFVVSKMEGNLATDAARYLLKAHDFRFRVKGPKKTDLKVRSLRTKAGAVESAISGKFERDEIAFRCDVRAKGTYSWSDTPDVWQDGDAWGTSPKGFKLRVERDLAGSVSAEGFSLEVDESMKYVSILFERFVENRTVVSKNRWTADGVEFALENWTIRKSFLDTLAAEIGSFWRASGTVSRGGKRFGTLGFVVGDAERGIPLRVRLVTEKETIVLEEWPQ